MPALPARDLFSAVSAARNWNELEDDLVLFLSKVAELFVEYFARGAPGASCDRVLCTIDTLYGHCRAQAGCVSNAPRAEREPTVLLKIPLLVQEAEKMGRVADDDPAREAQLAKLEERVVNALSAATAREPAAAHLRSLMEKLTVTLWVMSPEDPEPARPLPIAAG